MSTIHQDIIRVKELYAAAKFMGEDSTSPVIRRLSNRIKVILEDSFQAIESAVTAEKHKGAPYI